jgi:Protein of unknown function (DUF4435)
MATARTPNEITVDEVIALLKKTSLPTVIVEGSDDMIVYRRFEDNLVHVGVSVFPVGGRLKVLEVFNRRHEIPVSVKAVFIADQDTWINSGIPLEYQDPKLLFTNGYSIENDVYRDGKLWELLQIPERGRYKAEINTFVEWYALALSRHLADSTCPIALHHDHVLNPMQKAALFALQPAEAYPNALRQEILNDYGRVLRGKSLFPLLIKHTNAKGRGVRHTDTGLFEMVAANPGALLKDLLRRVEQGLNLV